MLNLLARIPIRYRLAVVLVSCVAATMLLADRIGVLPDANRQVSRGRDSLCQSLAITGASMVASGDEKDFELAIAALVQRNQDLQSVRIVDPQGKTLFETGDLAAPWSDATAGRDCSRTVPIFRLGQPWGELRVAFTTFASESNLVGDGFWRLLAFIVPICLLQFSFILERVGTPLNPERQPAEPVCLTPQPDDDELGPIHTTLSIEDDELREIVADFIQRLDIRLLGMLSMVQRNAFEQLDDEAHWLKGAGGTVGFPSLTRPAIQLMNASRQRDVQQCQQHLGEIMKIRQRIVLP